MVIFSGGYKRFTNLQKGGHLILPAVDLSTKSTAVGKISREGGLTDVEDATI